VGFRGPEIRHKSKNVMEFLIDMNEAYEAVRVNILMMKSFPDIDEIDNLLLQEENQRGLHSTSIQSPATISYS